MKLFQYVGANAHGISRAALLLLDYSFQRQGLAPPWWMRLRILLTAIVLACLSVPILLH